ncbi:MAG: hypothetical protein PF694_06990 [Bacteroidetes bacterium]|jgi:hypothetical protein|nr:hypothetical protein [Bacteroidota bacterium]
MKRNQTRFELKALGMRKTFYLILLFQLIIGCSDINSELELKSKITRLERINDSLSQIINESHGSIVSSSIKIIPSNTVLSIGDTMHYQILINNQRKGDIYPYLYFSDTCLKDENDLPFELLGNVDSIKMIDWQAYIPVVQTELGNKNMYFIVRMKNMFGFEEDFNLKGYSDYFVISKEKQNKINSILYD